MMDSCVSHKSCAVIPAAGIGERMGTLIPKQYCQILGHPLIYHTVESFLKIPFVEDIVVVCAPGCTHSMEEALQPLLKKQVGQAVHIVEGEKTRHRSIATGVKFLESIDPLPEVVFVHDGVRPLVPLKLVEELARTAMQYGSAGPVRPLVSTVIAADKDGFLDQSLDRNKYWASETPQAFKYNIIKSAYEKCSEYDYDFGTECLHLVHKYANVRAKLIQGGEELWKVTYKKDLYAAEGVLRERHRVLINGEEEGGKLEAALKAHLQTRFHEVDVHVRKACFFPSAESLSAYMAIVNIMSASCASSLLSTELERTLANGFLHGHSNQLKIVNVVLCGESSLSEKYAEELEASAKAVNDGGGVMLYFILCRCLSGNTKDVPSSAIREATLLAECFLLSDAKALSGRVYVV